MSKTPTTAAFVSQKGGVGKSTLARLLAVGAIHRGRKTLLADFDLDQLTCVEWGATRMRAGIEPEIDARAFKSLKKLRRDESVVDFIVADTRGLADELSTEIAEDSDVVFLPTGVSRTICGRRSRSPASSPGAARRGGSSWCCRRSAGRRSNSPRRSRRSRTRASNCCRSTGRSATASRAISTPGAPAGRRATPICARSPSGWRRRSGAGTMKAKPRG